MKKESIHCHGVLEVRSSSAPRWLALASLLLILCCATGRAQNMAVSPSNVNADSQGATSVLLTFGRLNKSSPAEATWCGALIPAAPDLGLKCDPATIFGQLPARYDQSTRSGANAFTDIMSITPEVARRADLLSCVKNTNTFFYVRRFLGAFNAATGTRSEYVPVTIHPTGDGGGTPFSLTEVRLTWAAGNPIPFVKPGETLPRFEAEITYTGAGRLVGRWELVKPGDRTPGPRDLLTEATLPIEVRGTQQRYSQLERFNIYLPPNGRIIVPGPEPSRVDVSLIGLYQVLLRIEASDDLSGNTDLAAVGAGGGIVYTGGVAGFPLPVLKYYVGGGSYQPVAPDSSTSTSSAELPDSPGAEPAPLLPEDRATLPANRSVDFTWLPDVKATTCILEVEDLQGNSIISAILTSDKHTYRAPPWLKDTVGDTLARWRVVCVAEAACQTGQTEWRTFRFARTRDYE